MRNFIIIPALLCLLFACSKKEVLRPNPTTSQISNSSTIGNCDIQGVYSNYYMDNNNFSYYKGYTYWGELDSLALNLYGDHNIRGKIQSGANLLAVVETATGDTAFSAILNSNHQPVRVRHKPDNYYGQWADFLYDSAGRLVQITGDTIFNNDYLLSYDSLGNVIRIQEKRHPDLYITFTYDYSTPINGGDYTYDTYYSVLGDLKICEALNLIDIRPHHKLIHATSFIFPHFDTNYTNQFIDSQGKLIYYEAGAFAYTTNWHCIL
jgi:hypothetical protein